MANRVTVVKDTTSKVFQDIADLLRKKVLIGIPESKAERTEESEINNARIGYIMEFGSPKMNIPARAFLVPGVEAARPKALDYLKLAVKASLEGNQQKVDLNLNSAGIIGANEARAKINSNIPPPLSPATIRNRMRQRGAKTMRQSEKQYFQLLKSGLTPEQAQGNAGIVSLINTGQLRNSITYVIRSIK